MQFTANTYKYGANVASGDIDGDGIFEIITGAGPGPQNPGEVNIFDRTGSKIVGFTVGYNGATYKYGINIASGDFDGDGQYEVVTGTGAGPENPSYVKIFTYDSAAQQMVDSGIELLAYDTLYGVEIAVGDVDDDGVAELITAPGAGNTNTGIIRIWDIDTSMGAGQWSAALTKEFTAESYYKYSVNITSADINGDGFDEIITGAGPDRTSRDTI
ncbi:MAG: FG-GAP repeat protein, partial [Nitrospirae bacterium]|nr:FG-GAP repeat protein [Nitrospirota bacterium]